MEAHGALRVVSPLSILNIIARRDRCYLWMYRSYDGGDSMDAAYTASKVMS